MSDITEKLRAPAYWLSGSGEGHEGENNAPRQAADEIDRLRAEVARLAAENEKLRTAMLKADCYLALNSPNIARETLSTALQDKSEAEKG